MIQTINRIKFKECNINQIMFYSNQAFVVLNPAYYSPAPLSQATSLSFSPQLEHLLHQAQKTKRQHEQLLTQLNQAKLQIQVVKDENNRLREELVRSNIKIKRRYRKRRANLQKKFICTVQGCTLNYSSKVALNSHLRKKHFIQRQTMLGF